jgi:hypothetical protein
MEFIDGLRVTDAAGLEAAGISPRQLSQLVSKTFNEMIFTFGDVHCDPHAANLVRRDLQGGRTSSSILSNAPWPCSALFMEVVCNFLALQCALSMGVYSGPYGQYSCTCALKP